MIKATLLVLKMAQENGDYGYYHHLSGTDLPIKSQDFIHKFCDETYNGMEFLAYWDEQDDNPALQCQWKYVHLFDDLRMSKNVFVRKPTSFIRNAALRFQKAFGITRDFGIVMKCGCQFGSYTDGFVRYLLTNEKFCLKMSRFMHVPDEKVIHTILWNSKFRDNLFEYDQPQGDCTRKIKPVPPNLWKSNDYEELRTSPCLFARKFNSEDLKIVYAIEKMVRDGSFSH